MNATQMISVCKIPRGGAAQVTRDITVAEALEEIRCGRFAPEIRNVRELVSKHGKDSDKVKNAKLELPAYLFSGKIDGAVKQAMADGRLHHSGILQLDFDGITDPEAVRDKLITDPHVIASWLSPSGQGVKGLLAMEPATTEDTHKAAFHAAEIYFATRGLTLDKSCNNSNRLCFAGWDSEIKIREDEAQVFSQLNGAAPAPAPALIRSKGFPEPPQDGIHAWLPSAARWCRSNGMTEAEAIARLRSHDGRLRRRLSHNEAEDACRLVYSTELEVAGEQDQAAAFFYDGTRYHLDTGREYVPMDQKSVSRHMAGWGLKHGEIEAALCRIQTDRHINYAGPLAGHPRGMHTAGGVKLLATCSPEVIEAAEGPWGTLQAVIENLLGDPEAGSIQITTFMAWVKIARESLLTNRPRPGQALAFAGPRGCGKTLLIDILERALGGRRSNPYPHFSGRTNFNADLAGAELLAVDDEAGSSNIRSRKALAASIKSCLFSGAVRIEGKHRCAFTFRPCWRMVMALNDEPEALLVLPPITEDITDKITLFRCHKKPLPMPAHTLDEREAFFATLRAELPGMLAWLEAWEIPDELREERCGVLAYHHPAILAGLLELSPEGQLAGLVDTAAAAGALPLPWVGTAAELKGILTACPQTARDAEKLLGGWAPATGTFLGRLEGNGRVERMTLRDGIQRWRILGSGAVD